jgi:RNase P/RNase MRP subunit POP5
MRPIIMKKIKPLKPTLKEKKRYVVFELVGKPMAFSDAKKAIEEGLHDYLGIKGMSEAGIIWFSKYYKDNIGFIKISNRSLSDVKDGLLFVKKYGLIVKVILVTGLIDKAKKKVID